MSDVSRLPGTAADHWDWQRHAACRGMDSAVFFHPEGERGPARRKRIEHAAAICAGCPVAGECREWARRVGETYGVWGRGARFSAVKCSTAVAVPGRVRRLGRHDVRRGTSNGWVGMLGSPEPGLLPQRISGPAPHRRGRLGVCERRRTPGRDPRRAPRATSSRARAHITDGRRRVEAGPQRSPRPGSGAPGPTRGSRAGRAASVSQRRA